MRNQGFSPSRDRHLPSVAEDTVANPLGELGRPRSPFSFGSRDPHRARTGMFRLHNCWRCDNGAKPCAQGAPNLCEYPRARND